MPRLGIIVPTFNEVDNLAPLLRGIHAHVPDADVIVVDDASPDGTGAVADRLAAADPRILVLHRPGKAGLGAAYVHGFKTALARGYDVLGEMDADGSHRPEDLPALVAALEEADVVIGSRYVPGGRVVNWPWHRRTLSRAGNAYTRVLLRLDVHDVTAGFRLYRRETLEGIELDEVQAQGYAFQTELVYRAALAGRRIVEVPITFVERVNGASKMTPQVARESLTLITRWGLAQRLGRSGRSALLQPAEQPR